MSYMKNALHTAADAGCLLIDFSIIEDMRLQGLAPETRAVVIDTYDGIVIEQCLLAADALRLLVEADDDAAEAIEAALEMYHCLA